MHLKHKWERVPLAVSDPILRQCGKEFQNTKLNWVETETMVEYIDRCATGAKFCGVCHKIKLNAKAHKLTNGDIKATIEYVHRFIMEHV
jgi:hypothetical protein